MRRFSSMGVALSALLVLCPSVHAQQGAPSSLNGGGANAPAAPATGGGDGSSDDSSDGHDQLDTGSGGGPQKPHTFPIPGGGGSLGAAFSNITQNDSTIVAYINSHGCQFDNGGKKKALTTQSFDSIARSTMNATEVFAVTTGTLQAIAGGVSAGAFGITKEQRATVGNVLNGYTLPGSSSHNLIMLDIVHTACDQCADMMKSVTLPHELMHIILKQFGNTDLGGGANIGDIPSVGDAVCKHHQLIQTLGWGSRTADQSCGLGPWTPPTGKPDCGDGTPGKTASADGSSGGDGDDSGAVAAGTGGAIGGNDANAAATVGSAVNAPPPVVGPAPASVDTSGQAPPPPDF